MLRGLGRDEAFERDGRWQQLLAAMFAFVVASAVVYLSYAGYFARNLVAPVDKVYVAAIKAGASPGVAHALLLWAIPGALLQWLARDRARRKRPSACTGPIELRSMGTQSLAQTTSYRGFSLHSSG